MLYSLSTKYAVMALMELAAGERRGPVLVREVANTQNIPEAFLSKLVTPLVKEGVLLSIRGRKGGIQLARSPEEISIADIVRITEGEVFFENCIFGIIPCRGERGCPLHNLWGPLRESIVTFLEGTTIADLATPLSETQATVAENKSAS